MGRADEGERSGIFLEAGESAGSKISLDRLLRQPRSGKCGRRSPAGEIFVHRNIANIVVHTDSNCLSVIQFAVEVLNVKDIIVCGHYGCGGIRAALEETGNGVLASWLRHISDIYVHHKIELDAMVDENLRFNLLSELNVMEQVWNVSQTTFVQSAWKDKQELNVHGWIYDISGGILRDLDITITGREEALAFRQKI